MKTCPVCHAATFDDAETCFGCLHRFEEGELPPAPPASAVSAAPATIAAPALAAPAGSPGGLPPAFLIRLVPAADPSGAIAWTCTVDLASRELC